MPITTGAVTIISAEELRKLGTNIFLKTGISEQDTHVTVESLVEADLRGVHSHGTNRIPWYVDRLLTGGDNPKPNIRILQETSNTVVLDGDNGLGQVVSKKAMELAISKAAPAGVGMVSVRNSHHYGACAYWAQMALPYDMIGLTLTNGGPVMAPWGGITKTLANDPIGVAVPTGNEIPIVLDMATTIVAGGKLDIAARKGETIPLGWALDVHGVPTQDPVEARAGLILPLGEYKGYGLTVIFEVLAAVLSGANFARQVHFPADPAAPMGIGHFFQAINVEAFMPVNEFKKRVDQLVQDIKFSSLAPGFERIYLPGEIEHERRVKYLAEGIPMATATIESLNSLAKQLGIEQIL
jgi:LDH2 family malate/lactate/ureidoglycolate dehydrogenase